MVISCSAYGCWEQFRRGSAVSFHSFPKDPINRKLWTIALRREGFVPTVYSKLCSKHFTEDSFDREKFGACWLKANAVPKLFDFSDNSMARKSLRRTSKRMIEDTITSSSSSSSSLSSFPSPERSTSTENLTDGTSILQSLLTPVVRNSSTEQLYISSESTFSLGASSKSSLFRVKKACVASKVERKDSSIAQHIKKKETKYMRYLDYIANGKDLDDGISLTPSIRWEAAKQQMDLEERLEVAQKEKIRLKKVLKSMRQQVRGLRKINAEMKKLLDEELEN